MTHSSSGGLRRGFKAEAERISLELRAELGLKPYDRLNPRELTEHLQIPVITLEELHCLAPSEVGHFLGTGRNVFSACTVYITNTRRGIVTNPAHAETRKNSSLAHELGHIVLEHEPEIPSRALGGRDWNGVQEREATWLAGCLLIPQHAAHHAASAGRSYDEVARHFGVSRSLAIWRLNETGALIRAKRALPYRPHR